MLPSPIRPEWSVFQSGPQPEDFNSALENLLRRRIANGMYGLDATYVIQGRAFRVRITSEELRAPSWIEQRTTH